MPGLPIDIKGIHNIAAEYPVNQVAHGTAKNKTVRDGFSPAAALKNQPDQYNRDNYRDCDKKVSLPTSAIGKQAECGAGVPDMNPVKERGHRNRFAIRH